MLGREELERLAVEKQALLVESGLNRLALQAELQNFRSGATWMRVATRGVTGSMTPFLFLVASVSGFMLARRSLRPGSWLGRAATTLQWIGPLYGLWQRFSAGQRKAE